MKKPTFPELLAPAGNFEKLITAIHYGADAVYLGGKNLSLRAKAGNFSKEEIASGIHYAHERGVKAYVTVNIIAHNQDLKGLEDYLLFLYEKGVDAIVVADPGVVDIAKKTVPELPIHLSTQANVTNYASAGFWFNQGITRLNVARELSLAEIKELKGKVGGELEVFVHGALCISYSGRCLLSNYFTGRDANKGECAHPCRYYYAVVEEKRPGEYFPVDEDDRGTYLFNSKDLCLLTKLPELIAAGVDALKVEGRMKSIFYVGSVVRVYRAAIDYLKTLPDSAWRRPSDIILSKEMIEEIKRTGTRRTTTHFIEAKPTDQDMLYETSRLEQMAEPVAVIRSTKGHILVEIRNRVEVGDAIEYMGKGLSLQPVTIISMQNEEGEIVQSANPGNQIFLNTSPTLIDPEVNGILRRSCAGAPSDKLSNN